MNDDKTIGNAISEFSNLSVKSHGLLETKKSKPDYKKFIYLIAIVILIYVYIQVTITGGIKNDYLFEGEMDIIDYGDNSFYVSLNVTKRVRPSWNIFDFEGRKDFKYSNMQFLLHNWSSITIKSGQLSIFTDMAELEKYVASYTNKQGGSIAVFDTDMDGRISTGDIFFVSNQEPDIYFYQIEYMESENNRNVFNLLGNPGGPPIPEVESDSIIFFKR